MSGCISFTHAVNAIDTEGAAAFMEKLIIAVAAAGSIPQKWHSPHVPITPEKIVRCGVQCEAAGAG